MARKIEFSISGVGADAYHDGQLKCHYMYVSSNANHKDEGEVTYTTFLSTYRNEFPIALNFTIDSTLNVDSVEGAAALTESGNYFSVYRREYQTYERVIRDPNDDSLKTEVETYQGPWEPVAIKTTRSLFRDFNITAGRSYQYILYPGSTITDQQYANATSEGTYAGTGIPVETGWNEWSLIELKPVANNVDAPILRKTYEVDLDNVWLFKYSLETGSQNQNFQKSEIQTLGQYQQMGYGKLNYMSGDVSCLLGSEIVPYSAQGYIERMRSSIYAPLSTNEKAYMLREWRKIAFSPNPKLLKDMKGQSWIVQITSNSNTPKNHYMNQPDTISFSWKQIDDTDNIVILGDGGQLPKKGEFGTIWKKKL